MILGGRGFFFASRWATNGSTGELCGSGAGAAIWTYPKAGPTASHPDANMAAEIQYAPKMMTGREAPALDGFYAASHTVGRTRN